MDEGCEHDIELVEAGKDPPESFEASEQAFYFVSAAVHDLVIFPGVYPVLFGWYNRYKPQIQYQLPCLIAFIRSIHEHAHTRLNGFECAQ